MDTKWCEDFVALAETRSFSRAAQLRSITQPAFSRRIQALEAWLGFGLIDRTSYPPRITPAGEAFYQQAQELLGRVGALRSAGAGAGGDSDEVVRFALPHTLSMAFFPAWLAQVQQSLGPLVSHLQVGNMLDVVLWLVEGACDLLICYHHPQQPLQLDAERFDMLVLGTERLAPYSLREASGRPRHAWPGKSQAPLPYLAYSDSAYLGRMAEIALAQGRTRAHLKRVCQTDIAEGLKQMLLAGHGVALLPDSAAANELAAERVTRFGDGGWVVEMQIRVYRERPTLARPAARRVEQLWRLLESTCAQAGVAAASAAPAARARSRRRASS